MAKVKEYSEQHGMVLAWFHGIVLTEHGTRHKVSYFIYYDTSLQNVTDIIPKCDSYFLTKCDKSLLQNVSDFL